MPTLICKTTSDNTDYDLGVLNLTKEYTERLLALRPLVKAMEVVTSDLSSVRLVEYSHIEYGCYVDLDNEPGHASWWYDPRDQAIKEDSKASVDASTVNLTIHGVDWSAFEYGSNAGFETPMMSWEQLETVAKGEMPFKELSPGNYSEPEDEDDKDEDDEDEDDD